MPQTRPEAEITWTRIEFGKCRVSRWCLVGRAYCLVGSLASSWLIYKTKDQDASCPRPRAQVRIETSCLSFDSSIASGSRPSFQFSASMPDATQKDRRQKSSPLLSLRRTKRMTLISSRARRQFVSAQSLLSCPKRQDSAGRPPDPDATQWHSQSKRGWRGMNLKHKTIAPFPFLVQLTPATHPSSCSTHRPYLYDHRCCCASHISHLASPPRASTHTPTSRLYLVDSLLPEPPCSPRAALRLAPTPPR